VKPSELKQARESLNLTQTELGDLLGLSRVTVWRLETGIQQPKKWLAWALKGIKSLYR